ncbi:mucin-4-like isoform X2 [Corvus cornix cornix]|uniref:mucin-4-like isoform X2 n=1 Tax=Corvus cornix cornix TaxID=932674 RepID=UPI0019519A28|nr:mucin-4-like isoform X2 [Corvus cornix cornix]
MGTRQWTLSTFLGCCAWILHGLGAVAAVPVTTDGPFTVGTAFPITAEDEWPHTTLTAEMSITAADAETFPPWTETDPVTVMSEYSSTVPALVNVTKPPNTTQSTEGSSAAPTTATAAAAITTQHPAVTPEAEHDEIDIPPDVPLGTTPVLEDVKEDILANREDTDLSTGNTTPPLAVTWVPQPTAGVTVLPSQGLTTAKGAVEEGVTLPEAIQSEASANSSGPSPDAAGELLPTQQDGAVGGVEGINPEPAGEMAPAGEESPLASESGDAGDGVNGEFSTASSSHLPPESLVMSGTVETPENSSLLRGQAVLSPDSSLTPSNGGDGQGVPGASSEASGSVLSPAASRAPVAPEGTENTATLLPAPELPSDAHSDTNLPVSATALPAGDVGAVDLASPSLQPAPWQTPTGEQPVLLPDALTSPTDIPSAPGAAYPAPEAGAITLPEADGAAETPASPDLTTGPEAPVSPSLREPQPAGMPAGAPQEADGLGTGLSSDSDAPSPVPFVPDGLAWPTAGIQGQGAEGIGDMAQAGGPGDASPYEDTQSDMSPPALQPSASPADNGELLTGGTEDLANAELSPPSALGDGTEAGEVPALGQVSSTGPAPPSSAGMEPDLSGSEGPGDLPGESASAPGAVFPPPESVAGPVSEAETPVSPDLSAAQGAPGSPSFGGSQPWGTAAGALPGAGLPGAKGPDTDSTSAWDTPSSAVHGPVGPQSPGLGDQLGTDVGLPAAEGQGAGMAEPALEGAGSGIESEPSLSSTTGNGIAAGVDRLPGAGSPSGIASPSDVVAAPSVSRGDEAGPISSAAPGPDSLFPASPDGETRPELGLVQGTESAGDVAQAGNPESESPHIEINPSAVSPQQDLTNTGELPAEETEDMANAELSPPSALGDGTGTEVPALGQVSSTGPAPPSSAGMEPDLSGSEGPGDLPGESASAPGAVFPPPESVAGPVSEAETPVSPDLSAAQGAPGSPSFGGSQPWGTAAGALPGAGLPGAKGPDTDSTSAWETPSSAVHGPVGPQSPGLGDQLGTDVGLPAAEGQGAGMAEPALEGAGSGIESEPSLSSTTGNGIAAGVDRLPGAGSPSGIASPSDVVAAPSVSRGDEAGPISSAAPGPDSLFPASPDGETRPELGLVQGTESAGDVAQAGNPESGSPHMETNPSAVSPQQDQLPDAGSSSGSASPSGDVAAPSLSDPSSLGALEGAGSVAEGAQPSLGAGTGVLPAAEEGASEVVGGGGSAGQSQAPTGMGPAGSETLDGETGDALQSASSSSSAEESSLPGRTGEAAGETSLPGAAGAGGDLNTSLEAAGSQEASVSAPGTQSGASTELSDGKLSKVDVVEVPGGALVNGEPSPGASLVPVAPDNNGVSNGMTTSVAASLLLPGHGLSSGLAPNGDPNSAPGTQSGSRPLLPVSPGGLSEEAGGAQSWSLEDEVASGMPAPLGEASPHAPISPNAAPVLPSAPQRGNSAEGASASPGLLALPAVPLYGYGARENDQEYVERRVDFNSPLFKPETGFPFGKTLRSSLYFTDNGQIIFPASDNSVLTYPNPPPSGFNGHEEVPMIAVFWDNADFSRGVGTTFYQEFSTLNTAKPPFVRDVEAKVRRYLRSSYSAVWTLKITWEKAPVYAARTDTRKTITYQAVLTTDGFRSYILMLYQDGGMQWDYTRLTSTNVLIGYTSGDGFYHNDDLTKRPPAAKYRPDQFRGYNTDLRGLWIYKLESRVGYNYRLKCLAWTGQQQEPRIWSQGLPTCPCSLQQGQQDPRFKSSRGGRWGARVSMLHSASPNQHGAGVRCLYDSQNQLIEGRQERYWRFFRQASPYRDQELKLYDWCCNRAGSAQLCAHYSEKRPKIGCDGYQSPSMDSLEEAENDSDEQIDGEDK